MKVIVNKPKPIYRRKLRTLPGAPLGNRVLIRPFAPETRTEGGIEIAEKAQEWQYCGIIIGAGDQAMEKLSDHGVEIGDEVTFGKYAGVIQEWQHIVEDGNNPDCEHDGAWDIVQKISEESWLRECRTCKMKKLTERINMADADDLIMSIDLQERIERGEMRRVAYTDPETGCRKYRTERVNKDQHDTYSTEGQK